MTALNLIAFAVGWIVFGGIISLILVVLTKTEDRDKRHSVLAAYQPKEKKAGDR